MESIRVGSAVVIESDGKILLAKSKKPPVEGMWILPGGGVEFGENAKDAAKREIKEETGLEIEVGDLITTYELIRENMNRIIFITRQKFWEESRNQRKIFQNFCEQSPAKLKI